MVHSPRFACGSHLGQPCVCGRESQGAETGAEEGRTPWGQDAGSRHIVLGAASCQGASWRTAWEILPQPEHQAQVGQLYRLRKLGMFWYACWPVYTPHTQDSGLQAPAEP